MDAIMEIARQHDLLVVEDAAQGVNSSYKGKYLGTIGSLGCFSFHETKNFISGEGGALVINDPQFIERAEIIREKGTNRSKFFRGEVDKYTWVDIGSSYLPSELIAAFLYAQLEQADEITTKRQSICLRYSSGLKRLADEGILQLPHAPQECIHNAHMFYILVKDEPTRHDLIGYLKGKNIHSVFHYIPLHTAPMGLQHGKTFGGLPVTEDLSERLIRLPCYYELDPEEQDRVISCIFSFFGIAS
jgi:dTDP-4-amino-4,6-dideoxygalactose transaminase